MSELFKFAMINSLHKKRVTVHIEDSDGEEVSMSETIEQINGYIKDELSSSKENVCLKQIYPLIVQILSRSITEVVGSQHTAALMVSQELFRNTFMQEMLITFYFLKFIQKNNLTIVSVEEDISEEEIEKIKKYDKAGSFGMAAMVAGLPLPDILKAMMESGNMTKEDLIESGICSEADLANIKDIVGDKNN